MASAEGCDIANLHIDATEGGQNSCWCQFGSNDYPDFDDDWMSCFLDESAMGGTYSYVAVDDQGCSGYIHMDWGWYGGVWLDGGSTSLEDCA